MIINNNNNDNNDNIVENVIRYAQQTNMIQIKHNKLRIPTAGRLTSWLFTQSRGVEFGTTEDKSI